MKLTLYYQMLRRKENTMILENTEEGLSILLKHVVIPLISSEISSTEEIHLKMMTTFLDKIKCLGDLIEALAKDLECLVPSKMISEISETLIFHFPHLLQIPDLEEVFLRV